MNDDKKMKYNRFPLKFSKKEIVRHVNILIQGQWNKFQPTVVCRSLLAYFTRPFRFNNEKERGDACSRNYLLGTPRFVLERFAHANPSMFFLSLLNLVFQFQCTKIGWLWSRDCYEPFTIYLIGTKRSL